MHFAVFCKNKLTLEAATSYEKMLALVICQQMLCLS